MQKDPVFAVLLLMKTIIFAFEKLSICTKLYGMGCSNGRQMRASYNKKALPESVFLFY